MSLTSASEIQGFPPIPAGYVSFAEVKRVADSNGESLFERRVQIIAEPGSCLHEFAWECRNEKGTAVTKGSLITRYPLGSGAEALEHLVKMARNQRDRFGGGGPVESDEVDWTDFP